MKPYCFLLLIGLFGSFTACRSLPSPQQTSQGSWWFQVADDQSEPVARHEASFIEAGGKFYLSGGRGIRPVSIFDPVSKQWTQGAKPPLELHHFQSIVFEGKIYVIGAMTGGYPDEPPATHVYIYHPGEDRWEKSHEIPKDRRRGSTGNVLYQGKIYVSCGIEVGHMKGHSKWFDEYDPQTGQWRRLPDAPRPRDHFQAAVVGNKMYVAGGRLSKAPDSVFAYPVAPVDVYDFQKKSWSTLPKPLPTLRAGHTVLPFGKEIWVIGGESGDQQAAHDEVEALHTRTLDWRSLPSLNQGRHGTSAILWRGSVILASGCGQRGGSPELHTMEFFRSAGQKGATFGQP
ncbi:MAG: galactose oxidase [Bacteroidota bacterium]